MDRFTTALLVAASLVVSPAFAQVTGTIGVNTDRQQGMSEDGHPLLYTPDPVQLGSSVSHWDNRAFPNLLMEPAINSDLMPLATDITDEQLEDIGWELSAKVMDPTGATLNIIPLDDGFFNTTPFAGAPGNDATTLGEARINLFEAVLGKWGETLESTVPIDVLVLWSPQFCDPNQGAVLASAGTTFIFFDDSLPFPDTWYHAALTEALVGADVTGPPEEGGGDIVVFMNSDIDEGCLGEGTGYYYGLDGDDPANQLDIAPVILHELGHGLGFSNFVNESTGETPQDVPSIYDRFSHDIDQARTWAQMNNAQRRMSAVNFGRLEWIGDSATAAAEAYLEPGVVELQIDAPGSIAGSYDVGLASFGAGIPAEGLSGELACLNDHVPSASIFDGCESASAGSLDGQIALIDRGSCPFTQKVANAQDAGAIGAIIANNAGNTPLFLGGSDPSITIPAVSVGRSTGRVLREAACGADVSYVGNDGRFQVTAEWSDGTNNGTAGVDAYTEDTALLWFFNQANVEMVVKVLDGCAINDHFWVFAGGLTNVEVTLTVVDTATGLSWNATNPLETPFEPLQDINAFATCP